MSQAKNSLQQQGADLERIAQSVGYGLEKVIKGVAGFFGLVLTFEGFKNLVVDAAQAGTTMGRFAESIGKTVETTQAYRQAFTAFTGGETGILQAIRRIKLDMAAVPLVYTPWMYAVGGLTGKSPIGKEPEQILQEIADAAARRHMTAAQTIMRLKQSLPLTEEDILLLSKPGELQKALERQRKNVGTPTTSQVQAMEQLQADITDIQTTNSLLELQALTLMEPFLHELLTMTVSIFHWMRGIAKMLGFPSLTSSAAAAALDNGEGYLGLGRASRGITAYPSSSSSILSTGTRHRTTFDSSTGKFKTSTTTAPSQGGSPVRGSQNVSQAIKDAALTAGISESTLGGIASIESSFDPNSNASNPNTQYKGLFQLGREEWATYGQGNIYDAHDNAMAAARMLAHHRESFRERFGRYPSDGELYMIHQQGLGFYTRGTMTNIEGNLPRSAPAWARTHEGFERYWSEKLEQRKARYGGTAGSAQSGGDYEQNLSFLKDRGGHDQRISNEPGGINPEFARRLVAAARAYESQTGKRADFGEMFRDRAQQEIYYGEYLRGGGGLAAPPGQSRHEQGLATDVPRGDFLNWLHQNYEQFGVEFLKGRAFSLDPFHVQMGSAAAAQSFDANRPKVENNETSTHVNQVIVHTDATDATGIAQDVKNAIGKQLEAPAEAAPP